MCGIYGVIDPKGVDPNLFLTLAEKNLDRGSRGMGWLSRYKGSTTPVVNKFDPMLEQSLTAVSDTLFSLGHCLAPTNGDKVTSDRMHPFETRTGFLAHNGLLLNYKAWTKWKPEGRDIDSLYIAQGIEMEQDSKAVEDAIAYVAGAIQGQSACWYYHKPTSNIYLWRCMCPIYISSDTESFAFSSTKSGKVDMLIPEGRVYKISVLRPRLVTVGQFKVENIYDYTSSQSVSL